MPEGSTPNPEIAAINRSRESNSGQSSHHEKKYFKIPPLKTLAAALSIGLISPAESPAAPDIPQNQYTVGQEVGPTVSQHNSTDLTIEQKRSVVNTLTSREMLRMLLAAKILIRDNATYDYLVKQSPEKQTAIFTTIAQVGVSLRDTATRDSDMNPEEKNEFSKSMMKSTVNNILDSNSGISHYDQYRDAVKYYVKKTEQKLGPSGVPKEKELLSYYIIRTKTAEAMQQDSQSRK